MSYNGTHHVVRFRNSEMWHFAGNQKGGIFYRRFRQSGKWEDPIPLISNVKEDFSVKLDESDHLHLICCSEKGEILYLFYNGTNWTRQVLSTFEPIRYTIRYPVVIPVNHKIHVLFAMGTTFNTGYWSLYHYYWDESSWHSKEITKLTAGYRLSPFYVDLSEKHIHLVYRGLSINQYQIFHCRYHMEHGIWSTPENVTQSITDCNMPCLLIRDDILHLTWTTLSKTDLVVKYKNRPVYSLARTEWSAELQLNDLGSNAAFPRLIWAEGRLWCVWFQADHLVGCNSTDAGKVWSPPVVLPEYDKSQYQYIYYSTNLPREKQTFQLQWVLGSIDESILLPIVSSYMDLPEPRPAVIPSMGWEEQVTDSRIDKKDTKKNGKETEEDDKMDYKKIEVETAEKDVEKDNKKTEEVTADNGEIKTPSLEDILLNEFDRQEEFHYSVITKLEEQCNTNNTILEEVRQTLALVRQNNEMLQTLKKDVEHVKQDTRFLKTRGFFQRLFQKES